MNKKILKWNFVFQYGWVLTNIFNSILLLPLYLKNIDANTLGVWLATGSILGWITLVDPGVGEVLQQKIAELRGKNEDSEVGKAIGSGFIASLFIFVFSLLVGFACFFSIELLIDKDVSQYPHLYNALIISVVATGMSLVSFSLSGINQGLLNSAHVAICALSANFLFLFINLLLLFLGYGVLSIAIANLCRALFIVIYNLIALFGVLKKLNLFIAYNLIHFKKFIRIFSFTSTSKIISGLAYSVDMLVLARFISPALITVFEINKRPFNITFALIGRHSVALMPVISHAKGSNDKGGILNLIDTQFRFYSYAALFAVLLFFFNYENLITAWTGKGQYAGDLVMYLLAINFFFGLICAFMANVNYALGDIKMNSMFNIIRNICYGIIMFFAAKNYGITGTLVASVVMILCADFTFYNYRVYKLGYLQFSLVKSLIPPWLLILPLGFLAGWMFKLMVEKLLPVNMYFHKLVVNSGLLSLFFILLVLVVDKELRKMMKEATVKHILSPISKLRRA